MHFVTLPKQLTCKKNRQKYQFFWFDGSIWKAGLSIDPGGIGKISAFRARSIRRIDRNPL
jgi:hypothetical protein